MAIEDNTIDCYEQLFTHAPSDDLIARQKQAMLQVICDRMKKRLAQKTFLCSFSGKIRSEKLVLKWGLKSLV